MPAHHHPHHARAMPLPPAFAAPLLLPARAAPHALPATGFLGARVQPPDTRTPRAARLPAAAPRAEAEAGPDPSSAVAATAAWPDAATLSRGGVSVPPVLPYERVKALLPHRYPLLLIDKVVALAPGERIIAVKNVSGNEEFFQGHFPQQAIMPGVLQVEALAQAGGLLMLADMDADQDAPVQGGDFFFGGVDKVKWRRPVVPGDVLVLEVEMRTFKKKFGIAKMSGR